MSEVNTEDVEADEDLERAEEEGEWVEDGPEPGEECGRWINGRLTKSCSKAGSEECDFECPYRNSLYE